MTPIYDTLCWFVLCIYIVPGIKTIMQIYCREQHTFYSPLLLQSTTALYSSTIIITLYCKKYVYLNVSRAWISAVTPDQPKHCSGKSTLGSGVWISTMTKERREGNRFWQYASPAGAPCYRWRGGGEKGTGAGAMAAGVGKSGYDQIWWK